MKWLFATLVGLNLIVFAGMIATKIYKNNQPIAVQAPAPIAPTQPPVVINMGGTSLPAPTASPNTTTTSKTTQSARVATPSKPAPTHKPTIEKAEAPSEPQVKYRNCSARVSMPEDDYHRIKGLLARFPHAATRQVVQGGEEGDSQISSRMNVLFMSLSDEDANTVQGIVGRYGSLNRAPCHQ